MTTLSPKLSSELAQLAYEIRTNKGLLDAPEILKKHFKFNLNNVHQGTSGGFFWRKTTGFVLIGQGHSQIHKNDHVIAIRGTQNLADALTNVACYSKNSNTGSSVHTGFQTTFASFRGELAAYIRRPEVLNGGGIIHCVGHSLGLT